MKSFAITLMFLTAMVLNLQESAAQVSRNMKTSRTPIGSVYKLTGTIEGSIHIPQSEIPNTTSINQIAQIVKQELRAYVFVPQHNGLVSDQYIHVAKVKPIRASTSVSVQAGGDQFIVQYAIQGLPLNQPMTVRMEGNASKSIRFALNPKLQNFPVAYLTGCDRQFECYDFNGVFIPVIK